MVNPFEEEDEVEHDEEYVFLNLFSWSCFRLIIIIIISYREEEKCRVAYKAIMMIHPHLPGIVKACANYPDTFISLIHMVRFYMRIYTYIYL